MRFPDELWPDAEDGNLAMQVLELFSDSPLVLTDSVTNSVYLNAAAEELLGSDAESLVNRAAWSLLGFDYASAVPNRLTEALLGREGAWKGLVRTDAPGSDSVMCEGSAVVRNGHLVCGVLRFLTANPN